VRLGYRFQSVVDVWTRYGKDQQPNDRLTLLESSTRFAGASVTGTGSCQCVCATPELAGRREARGEMPMSTTNHRNAPFPRP
jgi:hypothetical protein